jgi:hypothetical protein
VKRTLDEWLTLLCSIHRRQIFGCELLSLVWSRLASQLRLPGWEAVFGTLTYFIDGSSGLFSIYSKKGGAEET